MKEKHSAEKWWACINDSCRYTFGKMLTDNTIEIYGDKLNPKFTINFLRIKVRCPKCETEQVRQSLDATDLAKAMREGEDRKLGGLPYDEPPLKTVNRKMHGAKTGEEMKAVFPERDIVQETKLQNILRQTLTAKERQAYTIMVRCAREGIPERGLLVNAIASGVGLSRKEGERLHDIVMRKISEVKNAHLKEMGGEEMGDDSWWHRV